MHSSMNKVFAALLSSTAFFASVSTAAAFSDVTSSTSYAASIQALSDARVITGYPDGTFGPTRTVNRAELLVMAYRSKGIMLPAVLPKQCFTDMDTLAWYAATVCAAKAAGYVSGYPDGTFRPYQTVTLSEAAKILSVLSELELTTTRSGEEWYVPYLSAMADRHFIPTSFTYVTQPMSRGELAEILFRIRGNITDRTTATLETLAKRQCQPIGDETDTHFDMARIRAVWVGWMNEVRTGEGLSSYTENRQLDRTATAWAKAMRSTGDITHRRKSSDAYYDYASIGKWLSDQGITAAKAGTSTYSETIGWSTLSCKESDCTDELLVPLRAIFDLYLKEKPQTPGTFARSHYESVVSPDFTQIGFGFVLSGTKVYAVTHYVTSLTSDPAPVCR